MRLCKRQILYYGLVAMKISLKSAHLPMHSFYASLSASPSVTANQPANKFNYVKPDPKRHFRHLHLVDIPEMLQLKTHHSEVRTHRH